MAKRNKLRGKTGGSRDQNRMGSRCLRLAKLDAAPSG